MISAASSTSNSVKLAPPVTLTIASVAPLMLVSRSGLATACLAASAALFSPTPIPIPIKAFPRFLHYSLNVSKVLD